MCLPDHDLGMGGLSCLPGADEGWGGLMFLRSSSYRSEKVDVFKTIAFKIMTNSQTGFIDYHYPTNPANNTRNRPANWLLFQLRG